MSPFFDVLHFQRPNRYWSFTLQPSLLRGEHICLLRRAHRLTISQILDSGDSLNSTYLTPGRLTYYAPSCSPPSSPFPYHCSPSKKNKSGASLNVLVCCFTFQSKYLPSPLYMDTGGLGWIGELWSSKSKTKMVPLKKKKSLFNFVKPSNLLRVLIIFLQILLYFHIFFTYFYNL